MQATKNLTTNAAGNTTHSEMLHEVELAIGDIDGAVCALSMVVDALSTEDRAAKEGLAYLVVNLNVHTRAATAAIETAIKACPAPALQPDAAIALP